MKKEQVARQDGKAFRTNTVRVEKEEYKDPQYTIETYGSRGIGETGLLEIGRIVPVVSGLPRFLLRWDERQEALDVNIEGISEAEVERFKRGQGGYKGHHTVRIPGCSARVFRADIRIPRRRIFAGNILVALHREKECAEGLSLEDIDPKPKNNSSPARGQRDH